MNEPYQGTALFPPTLRQCCILLFTALVLALASTLRVPRILLLLLSPWFLGLTVMLFDRPGPVRNWLGSVMHSFMYPVALVTYNSYVVAEWLKMSWTPPWWQVGGINLLLISCFAMSVRYLSPHSCPLCNHRGLVPLMPWLVRESRSKSTLWCAFCGSQFWKKDGEWISERRQTWWDRARRHQPQPPRTHCERVGSEDMHCVR